MRSYGKWLKQTIRPRTQTKLKRRQRARPTKRKPRQGIEDHRPHRVRALYILPQTRRTNSWSSARMRHTSSGVFVTITDTRSVSMGNGSNSIVATHHDNVQNLCFKKSQETNIRSARLPIGTYLSELKTRKVLTVNQTFEILLIDRGKRARMPSRAVLHQRKADRSGILFFLK